MHVTEDEIAELPAGLAALIRSLFLPSEGKLIIPTCGTNLVNLACYLNHSPQPNIRTRDGCAFIALRKIRSGKELTVDYRTYSAEGVLPANVDRTELKTALITVSQNTVERVVVGISVEIRTRLWQRTGADWLPPIDKRPFRRTPAP